MPVSSSRASKKATNRNSCPWPKARHHAASHSQVEKVLEVGTSASNLSHAGRRNSIDSSESKTRTCRRAVAAPGEGALRVDETVMDEMPSLWTLMPREKFCQSVSRPACWGSANLDVRNFHFTPSARPTQLLQLS